MKKWDKISVREPADSEGSCFVREYNPLDEFMDGASILRCTQCGIAKSMFANENKCGCGAIGETWVPVGAMCVVMEKEI